MRILVLALCILVLCTGTFAADAPKPGTEVDIKAFGAIGDGKADDTAAIRMAIDAAGFGGTVRFPMGTYKLTGTLSIESVHLLGNISGGFPSDASVMPIIEVTHTDGPAIKCGNYSSVHGLCLQYKAPNWEKPVKYPPTILLAGNGISVSNVKIWGAYDAIAADGKSNVGRVNLENIFLPEVINVGVYLTKAYDIPTMRNVECFCTNKYFLENGVGFKLGRLDEFHASNCFVIGARTGFLFVEDKTEGGGSTYGGLMNCSTDACVFGYVVEGGARLRVTNGSYLSHFIGFKVANPTACLIVHGAIIQGNGDHILQVLDCGNVMFSACRFQKAFENAKAYGAYITGGKNIIINGCTFDAFGPGVYLGGKADKVTVSSCIFEGDKFPQVDDQLPKSAKRVLLGNQ